MCSAPLRQIVVELCILMYVGVIDGTAVGVVAQVYDRREVRSTCSEAEVYPMPRLTRGPRGQDEHVPIL